MILTETQPDPAFEKKAEVEKKNGHQRFEEEVENMEVEEEEAENISAEAMQALYNKSVSVPPVATLPVAAGSTGISQLKPIHSSKSITANGAVSCEEALLASQDQRVVSNGNVANKVKAPPRVVFRPRALDVAQLRQPMQVQ